MHERLAASWWSLVLRGIVAVTFGVMAFLLPGIALTAFILLFGAYALVDGVFAIMSGIRPHATQGRDWLLVVGGLAGVVVGLFAFVQPGLTAIALIYLIGGWAILTGLFEVAAALRLRTALRNTWWLAAEGVVSVIFGILVWVVPGDGALALIWLIAAFAVASGLMLIFFGLRLRATAESSGHVPPPWTRTPAR